MNKIKMSEDGHQVNSNSMMVIDLPLLASPLWTVEEVSEFLKLQPETIRSMARRGELPAIKIGKVWRFEISSIQLLLTSPG